MAFWSRFIHDLRNIASFVWVGVRCIDKTDHKTPNQIGFIPIVRKPNRKPTTTNPTKSVSTNFFARALKLGYPLWQTKDVGVDVIEDPTNTPSSKRRGSTNTIKIVGRDETRF